MRTKFILAIVCFPISLMLSAQSSSLPESADQILKQAYQEATKEKKNVFIMFHASWCVWCHKMDDAMNDPSVKKFFQNNFVVRHMVVYESKGKEKLENPGALEFLTKYKGNDQGIPFWLVFDSKGVLLADSKIRPDGSVIGEAGSNSNTGCPATKEEVAYFINVLKKTTSLNQNELALIEKRFRLNEQ